jgi:hypothetical protein
MTRRMARGILLSSVLGACGLLLSGCWPWSNPTTFELRVTPASIADLAQNAFGLFLVSIDDAGAPSALPAALTVTASAGTAMVSSTTVESGQVVEIRLYCDGVPVGTAVTLTVEARRDKETHVATAEATITEPVGAPDDRLETGIEMRDAFIPWLAAEHPELGITAETVWTPVALRPHILEVSFYMFLSDEWELVVWWHVMIPPYDWTRMYLRHRSTEVIPSFGAEISSRSAGDEPHVVAPPEEVWR